MQPVVMAAALLLAAGMMGMLRRVESRDGCISSCALQNMVITVEGCGHHRTVTTTVCAGHCYLEAPVFLTWARAPRQEVCSGEWTNRTVGLDSAECPSGFTFPVATACACSACDVGTTHCDGRLASHAVQGVCSMAAM